MTPYQTKLLAAIGLGAFGIVANAQDTLLDDSVVELDAYSVTASRMEIPLGKVGSSITVLGDAEIDRFEANLTSDVLRTLSGIYIRNNGGPGTSAGMSVRGLPVAPLVLIDGIEVNGPDSGDVYNFGNLPTAIISSAEVLRGAQSALYGGNALTGVISVSTYNPDGGPNIYRAGTSYGSHNTSSSYMNVAMDAGRLDFSVVGSYYNSDGFSTQPRDFGPEWADDDGQTIRMIHGRTGFDVTPWLRASAVIHYRDSDAEYDPGTPSAYKTPIFDNKRTEEQFLAKGQLDADLTDFWTAKASYSFNNLKDSNNNAYGYSTGESESQKVDLLNDFKALDNYHVLVGAEYEEAKDVQGGFKYETTSVFTENVYEATEDLTLTLGGRYDDNDTFGSKATWRTSGSYAIGETGLRLKGSYGTGFDAPEISELFGSYGNPDLDPEEGSSYDAGIEWTSDDTRWNVVLTYFHVKEEDKIEYLRSTESYANVDWVSNGLEASARFFLSDDTRFTLSYTYADAERKRVADELIMHSPSDIFTGIIDQDLLDDKLKLRLTAQYVGERETWDGPTDAFFTVDVAASYQISQQLQIWARVDNAFDEDYQEIRNYNGAPREYTAGIKFEF